jgi:hypothetical protein
VNNLQEPPKLLIRNCPLRRRLDDGSDFCRMPTRRLMQIAIRRYPVRVIGCVYGSSGAVEQCIQPTEKRFCASQRDDR